MKRSKTLWSEKIVCSYLEEYQLSLPEQYRITTEEERKSENKIIFSFCQTPPRKKPKNNQKSMFEALYDFFYTPMPKNIVSDIDLFLDKDEITVTSNEKTMIFHLAVDGVVLNKLKLILCEYAKFNLKSKRYRKISQYSPVLKESIETRQEKLILRK